MKVEPSSVNLLAATDSGLVPKAQPSRDDVGGATAVHRMRRAAFSGAVLALLTGAPLAWAGNLVSMPVRYDGRWAIEATTVSGACPATLRGG